MKLVNFSLKLHWDFIPHFRRTPKLLLILKGMKIEWAVYDMLRIFGFANFRYGGEAQMRFPSALPPPSNVGPILGSPVSAGM